MADDDVPAKRQDDLLSFNLSDLNNRRHSDAITEALEDFFLLFGDQPLVKAGRFAAAIGAAMAMVSLILPLTIRVATAVSSDDLSVVAERFPTGPVLIIGVAILLIGLVAGIVPTYVDAVRPKSERPEGVGRLAAAQLGDAFSRFQLEIYRNNSHQQAIVKKALGGDLGDPAVCQAPGLDALKIVSSRAWRDPWLADHRLDIDPVAEATEIYNYLGQVAEKTNDLLDKADRYQGTPTEQTYRRYADDLISDLSAVRGRVAALGDYQRQIGQLSTLLAAADQLPAIEQDGEDVRALMAESRRHEMATEHLDRQRRELHAIEVGLREIATSLAEDSSIRLPTKIER